MLIGYWPPMAGGSDASEPVLPTSQAVRVAGTLGKRRSALGNWATRLKWSRLEEVREVDEPRARGKRLPPVDKVPAGKVVGGSSGCLTALAAVTALATLPKQGVRGGGSGSEQWRLGTSPVRYSSLRSLEMGHAITSRQGPDGRARRAGEGMRELALPNFAGLPCLL